MTDQNVTQDTLITDQAAAAPHTVDSGDLKRLKKLIDDAQASINEVSDFLKKVTERKDYKEVPGVEGVYDGFGMVLDNGERREVPANYAAKSRLVYGDRLKLINEDGKDLYKQINKVERKTLEGVVSKKEGKWHVLTSEGSYQISERAAEFNNLQINDKVEVLVPVGNLAVTFAALDKVLTQKEVKPIVSSLPTPRAQISRPQTPQTLQTNTVRRSVPISSPSSAQSSTRSTPRPQSVREFVNSTPSTSPASAVSVSPRPRTPAPSAPRRPRQAVSTNIAPVPHYSAPVTPMPQNAAPQSHPESTPGDASTLTDDDLR